MLKRLAEKRNLITLIFGGSLFAIWILYLIFGSGEDKVAVLVLTPVLPLVIYGSMRLIFKIIRANASEKVMNPGLWFFLIAGALGIITMLAAFISAFPSGPSPSLGGCMGLVAAVLAEVK